MDILQNDEREGSSCHIVTSSVHNTILQNLLWQSCFEHLSKCRFVYFAKTKFEKCSKVITDFCGNFVDEFLVAYCWVGLKPIGHPVVEFFDKEVGFSWRA